MNHERTEGLIAKLAADLEPVKPIAPIPRTLAGVVGVAAFVAALVFANYGLKPDLWNGFMSNLTYAGVLIGILRETGEVYLFETLDQRMGNVRDFDCDFGELWKAAQARQARRYQKELGCQCTYECAMSVNTLFQPRRALRIAANSIR